MNRIYVLFLAVFIISTPTLIAQTGIEPQGMFENFDEYPGMEDLRINTFEERQFHPEINTNKPSDRKSTDGIKHRLDSTVSTTFKNEYLYDENEYEISNHGYMWNATTSQWVYDYKREYAYDADGNQTFNAYYNWDESTELWVGLSLYESAYSEHGRILYIRHRWDVTSNTWVNNYKYETIYGSNGDWIVNLVFYWDISTSQWLTRSKAEAVYDDSGIYIGLVEYSWDEITSQWNLSQKSDLTPHENGKISLFVKSEWDEISEDWVGIYKIEYSYDNNGNSILFLMYFWDEIISQWVYDYKYEYAFDTNGNRTLYAKYNWDETSNEWIADYKRESTYDNNENETIFTSYDWNKISNEWFVIFKMEFSYDYTYSINDLIVPLSWSRLNNKLIAYTIYNYENNDWIFNYESIFYYSEQIFERINSFTEWDICIYPNPTNDLLKIEMSNKQEYNIRITSLNGQVIYRAKINGDSHNIDMSSYQKGAYIIRLSSKDFVRTDKIIKL